MGKIDIFKTSIISALDRKYLLEKWIGDDSLVTIFKENYALDFATKRYINRYLPNLCLKDYKCYNVRIHGIKNRKNNITTHVIFYYFSTSSTAPRQFFSKTQWEDKYNNFRILRTTNKTKRSALNDVTNVEISDEDNVEPKLQKKKLFDEMNYFNSTEAILLFNSTDDSIEDCLSRRIDMFDEIINHKQDISLVVNKANNKNCELTTKQSIILRQRLQYLRNAYLNVLQKNSNTKFSFKECCDQSLQQMSLVGTNLIKSGKTIMQWNRIFRTKELFPHPNVYIEMGKSDVPLFLETFPEVKIELSKWAKANMTWFSCDTVSIHLREKIVPKIYRTYLDDCGYDSNELSMEDFLGMFGLKYISHTTTWRWMKCVGFKYCDRNKNYFCDRHEDVSNKEYRIKFIQQYLKYERFTYRWVHIEEDVAIEMEKNKELLEGIFVLFEKDNKKYREYHVDTHPMFATLKKNMSIQVQPTTRPLIILGQDESVFKQFSFSKKCWVGPGGVTQLLPKSEGYSRMISAFVSRDFGVGILLSKEELEEVNKRRMSQQWSEYISVESAKNVYGNIKKKPITDELTLVRFFEVGVNLEGFWNYDQMALQVEDIYDVLVIKYPNFDFLFMFDQSSGHGKMREGSLNVHNMGVRWGGKQEILRKTKIEETGPYQCILKVGDEQNMKFVDTDDGPFYLHNNHRIARKYDRIKGEKRVVEKNKKKLKEELKSKGHVVRGHCSKIEMERLAGEYGIALTEEVELVEEGWLGKPKGLLQVLWERGWIDEQKVSEYSLKGKTWQLDENKQVLPEHRRFVLRSLMADCADFRNEKSAMEVLMDDLNLKTGGEQTVKIIVSPKYHCELAGEGIEYAWGAMKRYFRRLSFDEKRTKKKFKKAVLDAVEHVKKIHIEKFSARCRRYMLTYLGIGNGDKTLSYESIERFVKTMKTHRNIGDQEKSFIKKAMMDSIAL